MKETSEREGSVGRAGEEFIRRLVSHFENDPPDHIQNAIATEEESPRE